jgi:predicted TIM-barrel fold metal-dependent hydrolase
VFIADAQVHIWQANTPARPWRKGVEAHRSSPLDAAELSREMDAAGVQRAVLVPPTLDDDRNDLALDAARVHPNRFAVMGRLDLDAPGARDKIATWRKQPGMLGLRYSFQRPWVAPALTQGRVNWLWEEAEKAGVPIMMLITHDLVALIDEVAARHPELKIVLDHLALPLGKKDEEAFRDLDKLLVIARRPNVAVKASALPVYTSDCYPFRRLHPYVRSVYDRFGPKRMFWGSDLSRLTCPYRECVTMFTEEMPWLSSADLEWIMGRGLCEWLEWN